MSFEPTSQESMASEIVHDPEFDEEGNPDSHTPTLTIAEFNEWCRMMGFENLNQLRRKKKRTRNHSARIMRRINT